MKWIADLPELTLPLACPCGKGYMSQSKVHYVRIDGLESRCVNCDTLVLNWKAGRMSDIVRVVVEEFDGEGNLVKRTTTTTQPMPTAWRVGDESGSGGIQTLPTTSPAYPTTTDGSPSVLVNGKPVKLYS